MIGKTTTAAIGKKVEVAVIFDSVQITIHCGDDYEAQVLYDDIVERLAAGESLSIKMNNEPNSATVP
jgi:hypothetical protein